MCRMNVSASIQKARMPPGSSSHSARKTWRSKRTCSVWVGVKAVKSWVPGSAAAQAPSSSRSTGRRHHRARSRSSALGSSRASTR